MDPALWELLRRESDSARDQVIEAIIRFVRPGIEIPEVRIVSRFGAIATCRIRARDVIGVRARSDVVSLKAARTLGPGAEPWAVRPTRVQPTVRATDVRRSPVLTLGGAGVVAGAVDWGVDLDAAAFRTPPDSAAASRDAPPGGATRFLSFWDQRESAVGRQPEPYGYGTVHDRDEIDRALRDPRPYDRLGYHPAIADRGTGTHGTHVLSIAAGNGSDGGPVGIAPEADLAFVHLADRDTGGLANLGDSVRLLEAVDFIARTAGSRPWVINLSVGRMGGPHDGETLTELALDALLAEAPGRFIAQSAGNYFRTRTHVGGTLAPGETQSFSFVSDPGDVTRNELEIWYSGADEFVVRIDPPGHTGARAVELGDRSDLVIGGRVVGRIYHRAADPNNGDNHIDAFLNPIGCAGRWTVTLEARRAISGRFDAWLERDDSRAGSQPRFTRRHSIPTSTTGTIANGHLPLVVGAYDGHDPARPPAAFSSAGPTRDLRRKPDLSAPGVDVLATRSAAFGCNRSSGLLVRKSGTSMATPHVTGAVALCLQLAGHRLDAHEIRSVVLRSCDQPHSPDPLHRLGRGYLNIPRLIAEAQRALSGQQTAPGPKESTMDTDNTTLFATGSPAVAYREYLYRPGGRLSRWIHERFDVVAGPGQHIDQPPQRGDLLIEVALGRMGHGRFVIVDEPELELLQALRRLPHGQLLLRPLPMVEPSAAMPVEPYGYAEDDPKVAPPVEPHVTDARRLWTKLFGNHAVLKKVMILDMQKVPSEAVRDEGYDAWTNSPTRIYLSKGADIDRLTLETTLCHEAVHILQFASGGRPDTYEKMVKYEQQAYQAQLNRLVRLSKDATATRARSKKENDRLGELLEVSKTQLDRFDRAIADTTKAPKSEAESRYRTFLLDGFLPAHKQPRDLYDPPTALRNPSAQESDETFADAWTDLAVGADSPGVLDDHWLVDSAELAPAEDALPAFELIEDALPLFAPADDAPPEQAPADYAPPEQAPADDAPPEFAPADYAPPEQAPAEDAPPGFAPAEDAVHELVPAEDAPPEQAPAARFRTVFYDRDSLRYLDGWTRASGPSAVFLIDRAGYDSIRADGARRAQAYDRFVAQALRGSTRGMTDLQPPLFVLDPALATVPLNRASRGDWDDLMIAQLIGAGRRLMVQSETDQWLQINRLFDMAKADARVAAQQRRPALEFVAYFVLEALDSTLAMVQARKVTMQDGHAVIPIGRVVGTDRRVVPGGDAAQRVIGDIHTHYLLDPDFDLSSTSIGTTIRSSHTSLHSGVSEVDIRSACDDHLVVYAVDSRHLHRANIDGSKNDKLARSGNVLREALRLFGGEPT